MAFTPFTENDIPSMKTFNEKFQAIMDSATAINPNLLDNAYFANPVDQRGGYVVPPGTTCFADAGLTTPAPATQTGGYRTVVERAETYCRFQSGNDTWYAAADAAVRGYTGEWKYTIDRWKASGGAVQVTDSGIHLTAAQTQFMQPIETKIANELDGRTVTVSILDSDGALHTKTYTFTTAFQGFVIDNDFYCQSGLISGQPTILFGAQSRPITMKAAGLELGTQQTLANQENGKWVLNEIPNYAEELAKCQRYDEKFVFNNGNVEYPVGLRFQNYSDATLDLVGMGAYVMFAVQKRCRPIVRIEYDISDGATQTAEVNWVDERCFSATNIIVPAGGFIDIHSYEADAKL